MKIERIVVTALASLFLVASAIAADAGKDLYAKTCAVCHAAGIAGAPRLGNAADWQPRIAAGMTRLYTSALKGTPKGMPAKGGNTGASDGDVKAAVDYMLASVKGSAAKPAPAAAVPAPAKPAAAPAPVAQTVAIPAAAAPAAPSAPSAVVDASSNTSGASSADINSFNRLLKPVGKRNPPPAEDGIHDPANDGTIALMAPLAAYGPLPKSLAGNRVNWVKAIEEGKINPRWDKQDPNAAPVIVDLNIVREVKGSMPDVVYPHKQHTEWLDCSNCHPAIFTPQKGANSISMAAILLGEKCGVCHGKVAFPVSECRLCHSKKKDIRPAQAAAAPAK
ncbi:MAG: c-type cytochrome [Betaproteobacteria bacterium]|nr:c-type cytochrome [Betaproteobacteria bacterium]